MSGIIAAIIFPIPFFHLWLHALLPWWKKYPLAFYGWSGVLWIGAFLFFPALDEISPKFFSPVATIRAAGFFLMALGTLSALSSFLTLGSRRFFVWTVLRPKSEKVARLSHGPFCVIPHPAYLGYIAVAAGNFLASGKWYLVGVFAFLLIATPLVILFEEEEMTRRLT